MTLVYAKIINICGAEPGTGGWGKGFGSREGQGGSKTLQELNIHIHSCLICLGGVHTYVMTSHTPVFVKN